MKVFRLLYPAIIIAIFVSCSTAGNKAPEPEKKVNQDVYLENENISEKTVSEMKQIIDQFAKKVDTPAVDAKLDPNTWKVIQNEKLGKTVDRDKTLQNTMDAQEGSRIKLVIQDISPVATASKLTGNIIEIASFKTPVLDKLNSRLKNIKLASEKIDGYVIQPDAEFSFNKVVGVRSQDRGFEEAPIIIKTEDGYGKGISAGGGVCQISTTLYNAAEKCGLEITERHIHSLDVDYVEQGRDATVSYGSADFKFRNNRTYPVKVRVYIDNDYFYTAIIENRNR